MAMPTCAPEPHRPGAAPEARKPIEVWTWPTPNGHKVHIMLEELGLPYEVVPVNIGKGDQFTPEFLAITPNHRIPAIVDPEGPDGKPFPLFESGAILIYLAEKTGHLLPRIRRARYRASNGHVPDGRRRADVRPVQPLRQLCAREDPLRHRALHERGPPAAPRARQAAGRSPFLAGPEYSIADICTFPWMRNPERRGIDLAHYPHLQRWHDAIAARPRCSAASRCWPRTSAGAP